MSIPSDSLIDLIKRHEGLSLTPYKCTSGKRTIGYGHNIDDNPLTGFIDFYFIQHNSITAEMAEYLLDRDIISAGKWAAIYTVTWPQLSQNRKNVIVSMIFNLGIDGYLSFKLMRKALENADYKTAAEEMKNSLWYQQVGSRAEELIQMMKEG